MENRESIGKLYDSAAIRAAMGAQRIGIKQLAVQAGVSHPVVSKARAGKDVRISGLKAICKALGITLEVKGNG